MSQSTATMAPVFFAICWVLACTDASAPVPVGGNPVTGGSSNSSSGIATSGGSTDASQSLDGGGWSAIGATTGANATSSRGGGSVTEGTTGRGGNTSTSTSASTYSSAVSTGGNQGSMQGGSSSPNNGGTRASGGSQSIGNGGSVTTSGGRQATGGMQSLTRGGANGTGGVQSSIALGGWNTGGMTTALTSTIGVAGAANATAHALIDEWITKLLKSCPCKAPNTRTSCVLWKDGGAQRGEIIDAIINACNLFGPPASASWKMEYCYAHLIGAINKESSFDVKAIAEATSTDPTVGLTQIRFSSTVCDMYTQGPKAKIEALGCAFPDDFAAHASESCSATFWKTTGSQQAHIDWMQKPACNVGLGAWYYYLYATGGGTHANAKVMYLYEYCNAAADDGPDGATLATGMMSHLKGPSTQWASITDDAAVTAAGGADYIFEIRDRMDCALGSVSGTHPMFIKLTPNKAQYCK